MRNTSCRLKCNERITLKRFQLLSAHELQRLQLQGGSTGRQIDFNDQTYQRK
jgi:hypothetical protein